MQQSVRGMELLNSQMLNKGTAFTVEERASLGLHGLLPPQVETLDEQVIRAYGAFKRKDDDLERHIYLRALEDANEVLFYRLLLDHIEEMTPIVYTPVVALGCQQFSQIYRRPRGLFISYPLRDSIPALLRNRPNPRLTLSWSPMANAFSASGIRASVAWASPSESSPSTRSPIPPTNRKLRPRT
jgi:malate dehydrogenase (oxaloacetate-decarboxylating)